jgi:hypothetical protein
LYFSESIAMKQVADPSIARAARVQHAVMLEHLQKLYGGGQDYYLARTIVMAEHGPRIARECGKETATMALNALCSYGVHDMPNALWLQNMQRCLPTLSEELLELQAKEGGKWVLPPRRRWFRKFCKRLPMLAEFAPGGLALLLSPVAAVWAAWTYWDLGPPRPFFCPG